MRNVRGLDWEGSKIGDIATPTDSRPRPKLLTPLMGGGPVGAAPISRARGEL